MEQFTQEEKNLVLLYDLPDRTQLINEIKGSLPYVIYPDEIKLMRTVIDKLENTLDGEYVVTNMLLNKLFTI